MNKPWLFGRHAVEEALRAGGLGGELWLASDLRGSHVQELSRLAREAGLAIRRVSRPELNKTTQGGARQGIALKVSGARSLGLGEFLASLSAREKAECVLVALDQIQDPQNFGAIARSAVCLGARALLCPERRSAPVSQAVSQASAGAIAHIPVFGVGNLAQALERLKERDFWIYGADMGGAPVWETRLNRPMVLVIGSEGSGLRPLVRERCDQIVSIPQSARGVQSLNASCAASVLLYEIARQGSPGRE